MRQGADNPATDTADTDRQTRDQAFSWANIWLDTMLPDCANIQTDFRAGGMGYLT